MNAPTLLRFQKSSKRLILFLSAGFLLFTSSVYLLTSPMLVTPLFQSESLIFVPLTILSKQIEQQGIGFASDKEIDAHIQILESGQLRDSLIQRFGLAAEYGIEPELTGGQSQLHRILASRIEIAKTRFGSVSVKVKDPDPVKAARMANETVELGNLIKENLLSANRKGALDYARNLYESKIADVVILEDRIDSLGRLNEGVSGTIRNQLSKLQTVYASELQELAGRKNHLEREQKSFETELPKAYVISKAIPDDQPVSPNRKLLTLAAGLLYIFIICVILIIRRDVRIDFR